jgi:hypothetical protein
MRNFIAIHSHEYGTTVTLFQSDTAADTIFNNLPECEDLDDPDALTQSDFARRINLNFEPAKGETLTVQEFEPADHDPVDLSDFC